MRNLILQSNQYIRYRDLISFYNKERDEIMKKHGLDRYAASARIIIPKSVQK
ncbi:MAG: hypothetical protein ACP5IZ_07095 [Thermoprotei archaeon]